MVNLRPAIDAVSRASKTRLKELFERSHFILGEEVSAFEREFAQSQRARYAVGVGSGTAAIELCLRAAGLAGSGREVLTSSLTAPFTGLAILAAGLKPQFADIDPDTLQLDPGNTAERVTRKTAVLLPVHLYGQPCELDWFAALTRGHGLELIQDACQAHGASFRGKPLTAFSPYVAYSFYPTKNLGCLGDGGAVLTREAAVARRIAMLRDGGRKGQVSMLPGINSRLDEMQACYLRAFLPHLDQWNAHRARMAARYDAALADCRGVRLVQRTADSVHHLYVIRARSRTRLRAWLAEKGIGTAIHYPVPMHLHPAFRDCGQRRGDLPDVERACREILSLPLWPYLPESAVDEVAGRIREYYQ